MERILTTHAGSLPRPPALDALWARYARGGIALIPQIESLVESSTHDIVAHQVAVGIDIVGNGEQGRETFFTYVRDRFSGFGGRGDPRPFRDITEFATYLELKLPRYSREDSVSLAQVPAAIDAVVYRGTAPVKAEIEQLQRHATSCGATNLFLTAPSPGIIAAAMTNRHYPNIEQYVDALADGLSNEYRAIVDAGLLLQIDAPDLAMERHTMFAKEPIEQFQQFAGYVIAAINRATEGLPRERVRLHVCWGNYDGPHCFDVPLRDMLSTYLEANVGSLVLSLANPRHAHEYRLLTEIPSEFGVVVGCIDTTSNYVEHPEVVADRLMRAVEAIGDPARVQAGTDCGFATAAGMSEVASEVVWLKLASLVEGANMASDRLGLR